MSADAGAYDEVLAVADGRSREDIETRAALAFDRANEARRGVSGGLSLGFWVRTEAILRAEAWVDVLRYLDRAGAATFNLQDFKEDPPENAGGSDARRYGLVRALSLTYGSRPFTFYERPGARTV